MEKYDDFEVNNQKCEVTYKKRQTNYLGNNLC
jgi:hypothetical protein